ncbi:MAG: serpin family protein [Arachnia sp.]
MNEDEDVARALRAAVPIPEVPAGLLEGARRRRAARRRTGVVAGGAVAAVVAAALILPTLPLAPDPTLGGGGGGGMPEVGPVLTLDYRTTDGVAVAARASEALAWTAVQAGTTANRLVSPSSLAQSLATAAEGARGASLASADEALGLSGEERSRAYGALRQSLAAFDAPPATVDQADPPAVPVAHLANRIVAVESPIAPDFLQALGRYFGTQAIDVGQRTAQETLDAWVREESGGLIERSGVEVSPATRLVLQDAVFFAAAWRAPLNEARGTFDAPTGPVEADFLVGRVTARYAEGARWTAARLPYGDPFAMDVILPAEGIATQDLTAADLDAAGAALDDAPEQEGAVWMPALDLAVKTDLRAALPAVDLTDLSGMAPDMTAGAWVQQARLRVTAQGTVGAAVTELEITASGAVDRPSIKVTRPYVLRVLDTRTGWPLFLGAVSDPTAP